MEERRRELRRLEAVGHRILELEAAVGFRKSLEVGVREIVADTR